MNNIKTTTEKPFFDAYRFGGVVSECIDWMRYKYDLGLSKRRTPEEESKRLENLPKEERAEQIEAAKTWDDLYRNKLPISIKKRWTAFDGSVIECLDSPLMDEIEANIRACNDDRDRERYIFTLLTPFKEICEVLTPTARIKRLETAIKECEREKEEWLRYEDQNKVLYEIHGKPVTPKDEAEATQHCIDRNKEEILRRKYISERLFEETMVMGLTKENMKDGTVENILRYFIRIEFMFANRLFALLLQYGIDLRRMQERCGVYLESHFSIYNYAHYVGSVELAQEYLDALPPLPKEECDTQPQNGTDEKPKAHFNCSLTDERLTRIFQGLKQGGFIASDSVLSDWLCIFKGGTRKADSARIKWICKNKKTRQPSKKSLLDLLVTMGFKEKDIRANINDCFEVQNAARYTSKDYTNYRNWNKDVCSEYHKQLSGIVKNSKQEKK